MLFTSFSLPYPTISNLSVPKPLKVLFVSSEVDPLAKTGGLADVAGALPKTLRKLGHDVRVLMPKYGSIDAKKFGLKRVKTDNTFFVPIAGRDVDGSLLESSPDVLGVPCYLMSNETYFGRNELYTDSRTKSDFPDNDERFIFFSRGTIEALRRIRWKPDVIHCNDWQTGLVPAYARSIYADDELLKKTKTVFTIHNVAYQGKFPKQTLEKTGFPWSMFTMEGLEFYDQMNFLKAGIVYADAVTTVSQKYAEEICSSAEFGYGMEGILSYRRDSLHGVLNGIDYSVWNPETDNLIAANYSSRNLEGKRINKKVLREKFGLGDDENTPLIGIISRLADQKGFDLLGMIAENLMELNLQLVILGTGEAKYHDLLEQMRKRFPNKIGVFLGFNNELAHLIESGSDMFLMPSRYEPCGLNQMYSLKYGTVPIVRATGGLDDTIQDFDPATKKGTGFKFGPYDPGELLGAIHRALDTYGNRKLWKTLMMNGMKKDFSWDASAKKYIRLYRSLLAK
jgi:starch synthase